MRKDSKQQRSMEFAEYIRGCKCFPVEHPFREFAVSAEPGGLYVTGHTMEEVEELVFLHALARDCHSAARLAAAMEHGIRSAIRHARDTVTPDVREARCICDPAARAVARCMTEAFFDDLRQYEPSVSGWSFARDPRDEADAVAYAVGSYVGRAVWRRIVDRMCTDALTIGPDDVRRGWFLDVASTGACASCHAHACGMRA